MRVFQHAIRKKNTLTSDNHFRGERHSSVSPLWENPEKKLVFHQALELSILNDTHPHNTCNRTISKHFKDLNFVNSKACSDLP